MSQAAVGCIRADEHLALKHTITEFHKALLAHALPVLDHRIAGVGSIEHHLIDGHEVMGFTVLYADGSAVLVTVRNIDVELPGGIR